MMMSQIRVLGDIVFEKIPVKAVFLGYALVMSPCGRGGEEVRRGRQKLGQVSTKCEASMANQHLDLR